MDKILTSIHSIARSRVKGIGLSLPSTIDRKKGVVYDISNIPYWQDMGIKKILEDEFKTKVWVNNDINCFVLGEKYYGMCKNFKDIVCISLGPNIGASVIVNNELFFGNDYTFHKPQCLSVPYYDCVHIHKNSFARAMEELNSLLKDYNGKMPDTPDHKIWNELGTLVGRLIFILLCNYDPQVIVLSGHLAKSFIHFSKSMDKYLEKFIHPQILFNMIIFTPIVDYQQALGAASMVRHHFHESLT